uniref:Odorant receptor n=1 Tax=Meteorus pulchricornis TaxID=51522 RepID=A0A1S5VFU2_9HYME|nr:olfactory receptor 97 [Meteorus pulchricornis]
MKVLTESVQVLCFIGLWKTSTWSGWKSNFYNMYTMSIIFLVGGFTLTQLLDLLFISKTIDEMIDNISTSVTIAVVCVKFIGIIMKSRELEKIRLDFVTGWLKPTTADEISIQEKYNRFTKITTLITVGVYEASAIVVTAGRIIEVNLNHTLPYRAYLPFDYSKPAVYYSSVAVQSIIICIAIIIDSGFDTLFFGVMIQISAKIDILKYQFRVAVEALEKMCEEGANNSKQYRELERRYLGNWICCHNAILSLCSYVESVFSKVIFVQYSVSFLILCSVIYRMARTPMLSVEFLSGVLYLVSTGSEMFMLCFFSNQVTLNLADLCRTMYDTNWFHLCVPTQRKFVPMMTRTLKPVVFTSGHVVTLSLESFTAVSKI